MACTTTESCAAALTLKPTPCTWIPRLRPERKVSVHFTGLLAHWFENVVQDNILFGMDEITLDGFFVTVQRPAGRDHLLRLPACCSIEELRERMDREHIRVFFIDSSLGLCGFVLAQEVNCNVHNCL